MKESLYRLDSDLLIWINSFGIESMDSFWLYVTSIWTWIPLFVFIVYLFLRHLNRQDAFLATMFFGATGVAVLAVKTMTKMLFQRLRPCNVEELAASLRVLLCEDSYSFFSGHASFSFAITSFAVLSLRKEMKGASMLYIWPILFALSRMIAGVHYPSDIIVGAGVGLIVGAAMHAIYQKKIIKLPAFLINKFNL